MHAYVHTRLHGGSASRTKYGCLAVRPSQMRCGRARYTAEARAPHRTGCVVPATVYRDAGRAEPAAGSSGAVQECRRAQPRVPGGSVLPVPRLCAATGKETLIQSDYTPNMRLYCQSHV